VNERARRRTAGTCGPELVLLSVGATPKARTRIDGAILIGNQQSECTLMYQMLLTDAGGCARVRAGVLAFASRKDAVAVILAFSGSAYHHVMTEANGSVGLSRFIRTPRRERKKRGPNPERAGWCGVN
jgi:hypothetical protein